MLPEFGNARSPLPESGEKVWPDSGRNLPNLGHFGRILPEPTGFRPFWPKIRQYSGGNLVRRRPDVVGLRRRLDFDDRQLLNSDDRISNIRVRTKGLMKENDLQF
jgi:hypothetical protein